MISLWETRFGIYCETMLAKSLRNNCKYSRRKNYSITLTKGYFSSTLQGLRLSGWTFITNTFCMCKGLQKRKNARRRKNVSIFNTTARTEVLTRRKAGQFCLPFINPNELSTPFSSYTPKDDKRRKRLQDTDGTWPCGTPPNSKTRFIVSESCSCCLANYCDGLRFKNMVKEPAAQNAFFQSKSCLKKCQWVSRTSFSILVQSTDKINNKRSQLLAKQNIHREEFYFTSQIYKSVLDCYKESCSQKMAVLGFRNVNFM